MRASSSLLADHPAAWRGLRVPNAAASGSEFDDGDGTPARSSRRETTREDLPYRVELWDKDKQTVEQVLAVTASGSIGFAAYYAALREYPDRYICLRHKNAVVSRSTAPEH